MLTGLSAFPLTPLQHGRIDESAFAQLMERLVVAGVDSICVLGSTGNYAYLDRDERRRVVELAAQHAGGVPLIVGIAALRTSEVLALAEDAQQAGAGAVLLAPMSYQPLTADEVFGLYDTVCGVLSVPVLVYDNPVTTRFEFSDELHASIARLPNVGSIKIPPVLGDIATVHARVEHLRALLPPHVTLGISGDATAVAGLLGGCDVWYSVLGGLFPATLLEITRAAQAGDDATAIQLSECLEPIWALFRQHGSLRVVASAAELLGYAGQPCLPAPLRALQGTARQQLAVILRGLQLR